MIQTVVYKHHPHFSGFLASVVWSCPWNIALLCTVSLWIIFHMIKVRFLIFEIWNKLLVLQLGPRANTRSSMKLAVTDDCHWLRIPDWLVHFTFHTVYIWTVPLLGEISESEKKKWGFILVLAFSVGTLSEAAECCRDPGGEPCVCHSVGLNLAPDFCCMPTNPLSHISCH